MEQKPSDWFRIFGKSCLMFVAWSECCLSFYSKTRKIDSLPFIQRVNLSGMENASSSFHFHCNIISSASLIQGNSFSTLRNSFREFYYGTSEIIIISELVVPLEKYIFGITPEVYYHNAINFSSYAMRSLYIDWRHAIRMLLIESHLINSSKWFTAA